MFITLTTLVGCSGSGSTTMPPVSSYEPETAPVEPAGPAYTLIYFGEKGLELRNLETKSTTAILPNATYLGPHRVSPTGTHIAVGFTDSDEASLSVVNLQSSEAWEVFRGNRGAQISLAWSHDGQSLAFGTGNEETLGPAEIQIADLASQATQDVGCSVASEVVRWLPSGELVVTDGANLYQVNAADCATIHTLDARKMHHVSYSPDGNWMSYIYRDLVYNRDERKYEPDSTLFVANSKGEEAKKVIGYKYRPRGMTWAPNSTELAYDVQDQDNPEARFISIYDLEQGTSAYLNPPDANSALIEQNPHWSESGDRIAFNRMSNDGVSQQTMVRTFAESYSNPIAGVPAKTIGWVADLALVLTTSEGVLAIPVDDPTPIPLTGVATLLHVKANTP